MTKIHSSFKLHPAPSQYELHILNFYHNFLSFISSISVEDLHFSEIRMDKQVVYAQTYSSLAQKCLLRIPEVRRFCTSV